MAALFYSVLLALMSLAMCGEYTVTDEVWFDVEVQDMDGPGKDYKGRFTIAVFGEVTPMTALNFLSLARGHKKLHYKDTQVHRIITDFVIQMGDVEADDGTGGRSIYGETFSDEDFIHSHRSPGWVAMANHGPDTNGSQFYITLTKARWLDGKHVVFGKVVQGYDVVETVGSVATDPATAVPVHKILIVDCGVRALAEKYDIQKDQLDSTDDL